MARPTRIAILGGGLAGLTAAYQLTATPERRARYQVTVYQMGWRLGGKAASGRGPNGRVEEHGLHLFFGFYDNTFATVRAIYDAVAPEGRLPDWRSAFVPQHGLDIWHRFGGDLHRWNVRFPRNDQLPGDPHPLPGVGELLERALGFAISLAATSIGAPAPFSAGLAEGLSVLGLKQVAPGLARVWPLLEQAAKDPSTTRNLRAVVETLSRALAQRFEQLARYSLTVHRAWVALDWVMTVLRGVLVDRLARPGGWESIDDRDYRDWLKRHGASEATLDSVFVRAYYSAVLAAPDDRHIPVGAGTALRTQLRMFFTYRGAFLNKIRTGLGDSVIAPLYRTLGQQGVRFHFFHKVLDVHPEGRRVSRIRMLRQAQVRRESYHPLIRVRGLDAWPSAPLWDQLEGPPGSSPRGFESEFHASPGVDLVELKHGRDFDSVIMAIPLGGLPYAAPSLLQASERWRAMVTHVRDIATQSFQLWLGEEPKALGWRGDAAFSTSYRPPVDTWADVSFVLEHENWPAHHRPRGLLYFTGFLDDAPPAPLSDTSYPAREQVKARETMARYVDEVLPALYPQAKRSGRRLLYRQPGGEDVLATQFCTANVEPWERYVLSAPGTNRFRLPADDTDFDNLSVAGDWIANGMYSGCAEGAVIGGMQAARAVSQERIPIAGEHYW